MKKKSMILLALFAFIVILATMGFAYQRRKISSPQYPKIQFAEDTISVTVDASDEELLQGVSAYDPEDGDVSQSLVVEGLSNLAKGNAVKVTYAAFDSQNHVTKAQRTVTFTDYNGPRFKLSTPMIFTRSNDINVLSIVTAADPFDGDISSRVKYSVVTNGVSLSEVGEYEIKLMVTNSIGDTASLTLPVEIVSQGTNFTNIELSDYIVYLKVGDEFAPKDYVVGYTVNGEEHEGANGISIKNNVDTDEAGVYTVTYTYYGNQQSYTRLLVVVE